MRNTVLRLRRFEIPVGIAATRRESKLGLRLLHRQCKTPVAQRLWCVKHGRALDADKDTIRGFEIAPGRYLPLSSEQLATVAVSDSEAIEISCFVPTGTVPAQLVTAVYYLLPSKLPVGARDYAALQQVLGETGLVGLCRFHWRSEWIAAIAALPGTRTLTLTRLAPLGELVEPQPIDALLADVQPTRGELTLARRLVNGLQRRRPAAHALDSTSQQKLRALIEETLNRDSTLEATLRKSTANAKRHQRDTARAR